MKESYGEGVATHTGPESCAGARKGDGEALTGGRAGRVLSREIHDPRREPWHSGVPTPWRIGGRPHRRVAIARRDGTLRGQRPRARTETPRTGTGRSRGRLRRRAPQTASGSPRTHADDGRPREVGQLRSTGEVAEQRRGTGGGGGGGKGAGQGELARAQRAPDAEPGQCAKRARAGTASSKTGQETAVHRAPAPRLRRRAPAGGLPRAEARRGRRRRRRDVAALRARRWRRTSRTSSDRLKRGAYRAKPVRRAYIPKADGRQRPLGVPALEDKIVQRAVVEVLNAIYEHGLPRLLVRVPAGAQPASRAGCAHGRHRRRRR